MSDTHPVPAALEQQLARWVTAGLISPDQAVLIGAAEGLFPAHTEDPDPDPGPPPQRLEAAGFLAAGRAGYVVEALGYVGGTLAAVAGFIAVDQLWPDIPTGAQIAFAAAGVVLLVLAGGLVPASGDPALARLRSVLWALSIGCLVALLALLTGRVWELAASPAAMLTSGAAAAGAGLLWWRLQSPIQHLVLFTALAVATGTAISWAAKGLGADQTLGAAGYAVWVFSALWAVLALRSVLTPALTGQVAAAIGMLIGVQFTMDQVAGNLLAVLTVAGLMAAGVIWRQVWLLGAGALGVLIVVPQVASRYLPETVAAPLAVFVVGVLLLAVALWLSRGQRRRTARTPPVPGS